MKGLNKKKIVTILIIYGIVLSVFAGGTIAYLNWVTSEKNYTWVTFTVDPDRAFICEADVGGDISPENVPLAPVTCTDPTHAIKRELKVKPTILSELPVRMDLWIDIKSIAPELSATHNFKYAITTDSNSCTNGVITSGTFQEKTENDVIEIFRQKEYAETTIDTYYLYVWLDAAETNPNTMNKSFNLTINGNCENIPNTPENITVSFDANGGTGAPNELQKTYGVDLTLSSIEPILTGKTFVSWNTEPDGTGTSYSPGDVYSTEENVTLYAQWTTNTVTIYYNVNGGTITPSTTTTDGTTYSWTTENDGTIKANGGPNYQKISYGTSGKLYNYDNINWINITKTGSVALENNEWICLSGCTTENKTFDDLVDYSAADFCDVATASCEVELGVNWRTNKVLINFHVNEGSVTSSTTTSEGKVYNWTTTDSIVYQNNSKLTYRMDYGTQKTVDFLPNYNNNKFLNITRSGYSTNSGAEWICHSGCTTANKTYGQDVTTYKDTDFCNAATGDCTVVLKVNWIDNIAPTATLSATVSNNSVTASLSSVVEQGSGIKSYYYGIVASNATCSYGSGTSSTTNTWTGKANGSYKVCAKLEDNAGNTREYTKTVTVEYYEDEWVDGKTGSYEFNASSHYNWSTQVKLRVSWSESYNQYQNKSKVSITNFELYTPVGIGTVYAGGGQNEHKGVSINGTLVQEMSYFRGNTRFPYGCNNEWCPLAAQPSAYPWTSGEISHATDGTLTIPIKVDLSIVEASGNYSTQFNNTTNITLTDLR